jgi:1-acyl-sn-glycerol-3-phosphate acyltransferase
VDPEKARSLTRISADEMLSALHLETAPRLARTPARAVFYALSRALGEKLARFDDETARDGLGAAARALLARLGATHAVEGSIPRAGGLLVATNHPGAYDALVLMAAIDRRDMLFLAAERAFLRALPEVARSLLFIPEREAAGRARALRRAVQHLRSGGAIVHFGAGAIEPDPAFSDGGDPLGPWIEGTGLLARAAIRAGASVVPALVSGVHSPRAKALAVTKWAERRNVTTLAPLLQITLPPFRDVRARVRFGAPMARDLLEGKSDEGAAGAIRAAARDLVDARR